MQLNDCPLTVALPELVTVTDAEGTLGGSIPLRAARACVPFVRANALGARLSLVTTLSLRRRFGRVSASLAPDVVARHRAVVPMLARAGLLAAEVARRFAESPCVTSGASLLLFTGVFVTPPSGAVVRIGHAGNRRAVTVDVCESLVGGRDGAVPIVLTMTLASAFDRAALVGEIAAVARVVDLHAANANGRLATSALREHASFFDQDYFESKKRAPTRKYAKRAKGEPQEAGRGGDTHVVRMTTPQLVAESRPVVGATGAQVGETGVLVLRAAMRLRATWDGHTLAMDADDGERAAYADAVSRGYRAILPDEAHAGARLYFAKYATPHQAGEPFFFVKPPELVVSPPGVSSWLVGTLGDGWETLSGLVDTDWFHATPAVFRVHRLGGPVTIGKGAPLFTAYGVRRVDADAPMSVTAWDPFA